jgi:chaperonin GroES
MSAAISDLVAVKFHPIRDNILIRRQLIQKATTRGIMIPDTAQRPLNVGSVLAVGPGWRTSGGTLIPPSVAPGDAVALERGCGIEVTLAGERLVVISERDILGVFVAAVRTDQRSSVAGDIGEAIAEPERALSRVVREESLETDVAPDLLDREPLTGEDLH